MKTYYDIVTAKDIAELVFQVQVYLDKGWTCQGGVAFCPESDSIYAMYFQALIKSEGA
jgi:hypothetical protein